MHRIVTVTGDAVQNLEKLSVCTGTCYRELLRRPAVLPRAEKIISGGPMMGFGLYSLDVPVTKTSSALLCMTKDEVSRYEETACINCGRCVEACPEQLVPRGLRMLPFITGMSGSSSITVSSAASAAAAATSVRREDR